VVWADAEFAAGVCAYTGCAFSYNSAQSKIKLCDGPPDSGDVQQDACPVLIRNRKTLWMVISPLMLRVESLGMHKNRQSNLLAKAIPVRLRMRSFRLFNFEFIARVRKQHARQ
jgi:hypothetical protein